MGAMEMLSAGSGIRCLIAIGEDLGRLFGPTDLAKVRPRLEMGISLSSFVSPTTNLADLALPMAMAGEHECTIRRPDGRVWWSEGILDPAGQARTAGMALKGFAEALGGGATWDDTESLWGQIKAEVPGYSHVDLSAALSGKLPSVGMDTPQVTAVVPPSVLTAPPIEVPTTDQEHQWLLLPRSTRGGWTTDPRCQGAHILRREATLYREPYVLMAPDDVAELEVREGERVQIVTSGGASTARVRSDAGLPAKMAILPTEFPGVIRTLAGLGEGSAPEPGLPASPIAGTIRPQETR
jgi:anaerobic selenocysteine-containing dehydrogenase